MIRLLVDTSVAIPLVMANHSAHDHVNLVVADRPVHLAGHAAIETYSVLTRLPGDARVAPADAIALLSDRFVGVEGPQLDPLACLHALSAVGIEGGATYDGLVALACLARANSKLLSRDRRAMGTYSRLGVEVELVAEEPRVG